MITPPPSVIASSIERHSPSGTTAHCRASNGGSVYCVVRRHANCLYVEIKGQHVVRITSCVSPFTPLERYTPKQFAGPPA